MNLLKCLEKKMWRFQSIVNNIIMWWRGSCVQIVNSEINWNSKVYFDIPMRRQQMHKRKLGKRWTNRWTLKNRCFKPPYSIDFSVSFQPSSPAASSYITMRKALKRMRFRAFSIDIGGNNLPCGSIARNFDFVIKLFKRGRKSRFMSMALPQFCRWSRIIGCNEHERQGNMAYNSVGFAGSFHARSFRQWFHGMLTS